VFAGSARLDKPGTPVDPDIEIEVRGKPHPWVSRGGLKLDHALDAFAIDVAGMTALDVGASTGGFTDVLLSRGAAKVYAVDVGHDQLHETIRQDPRVVALEGWNAKDLTGTQVPEPIELVVCDVSFVSVLKVLEAPLALCGAGAVAVILIKPQFEVGRGKVGKRGIVTDEAAIGRAVAEVVGFMAERGWRLNTSLPSPIAGGDGNKETVAVFERP
jgi:23S rRNA (cytidine1920-2'-O)/16S rRNA (cytidine1409-2'-O)-methyltransferase